ncbi:class I SAM-dependent RNA methyltransferase [Dietzia timorensis]|uniref:Putative RNA methyltransferase n=1 Tax=Dietzia timorensis TaxID=499555 RepID=A0A173LLN8_9ACTN|nr:TRAM domain-containing protein [Dietzia timorensis]ANI92554.1 putative RNA methyltransferase [Dietzia timorensis]
MTEGTITVTADAIAHGGEAICRNEGLVVFVPGLLPGETAAVRITSAKKSFARAEIVELVSASPERRPIVCPAAAAGAGCCDLAYTTSAHARALKTEILRDQLRRLGGFSAAEWEPVLDDVGVRDIGPSAHPGEQDEMQRWRTVARWHSDSSGRIGVRRAGSHRVVTEDRCSQVVPEIAAAVELIESAGAPKDAEIVIAAGIDGDVAVQWRRTEKPGSPRRGGTRGRAQRRRARSATAAWKALDGRGGLPTAVGRALEHELMPPWIWHLEASAFWQAHRSALVAYADVVRESAAALVRGGREELRVWDLYGGVGALGSAALDAATFAGGRARVTAVETAAPAVIAGRDTARRIGADLDIVSSDVRSWLEGSADVMPDLVITDPPRAGLGADVIGELSRSNPGTIVHIGCDIASFARDLGLFADAGFGVERIQGIDAFPGTHHLEAVAVLSGRS